MKIVGNVLGVLLVLAGCVWFLQGIGVLPGSFMSGQTRWAVYGGGAVVIGAAVLATIGVRKVIVNSIGILLLLLGCVWIMQGINVLPGSVMSGQKVWVTRGAIVVVLSIALVWANRRGDMPAASTSRRA
jgi:hypothetical protein